MRNMKHMTYVIGIKVRIFPSTFFFLIRESLGIPDYFKSGTIPYLILL